ncbi:MAG: hypothetical protein K8W52_45605 [Deltaproteobacteria bacterium]|nr:hypothetical protein [Deltaproteobacteria bacterium]
MNDGRIVEFTERLHKLVAKAMNALRGRRENFWASEPPCLVRLVEPTDVMSKLVYAVTNRAGISAHQSLVFRPDR